MAAPERIWHDILVRPVNGKGDIASLDRHLSPFYAVVPNSTERGEIVYTPNPDGVYIVRSDRPSFLETVCGVIERVSFRITGVTKMPEGVEVPLSSRHL